MSSPTSQLLTTLAWTIPFVAVWISGIVAALARYSRHPTLSALLVVSLSLWMLVSISYSLTTPILIVDLDAASISKKSLYLGILGIRMGLFRTAVWAAMIVGILGWRNAPGQRTVPLQFSIRGLITVTLAVAVLCALIRAVVGLPGDLSPLLLLLVDEIPVIVCLGFGICIAAAPWRLHPQVSRMAIWALALALAVTIVPQMFVIAVAISPSRPLPLLTFINSLFNFGGTLASIPSWARAITAALGWRRPELACAAGLTLLPGES
jgi:hypothetical protein